MPASRPSSSGVGRRPSAPRPAAPRAGTSHNGSGRTVAPATGATRTGSSSPRAGARPAGATPPPGPQRGTSGPGRGGPRVERVRARTPKLVSARMMVLGVVALLAFVLVYPTLHSYLAEKAAVDSLRAQVAAAQKANGDLTADLGRWNDPAYVAAQARERLSFVMPGETAWRVVDPQTVPGEAPAPVVTPEAPVAEPSPWYVTVWHSVRAADTASDEPTKTPSGTPAGTSSSTPATKPSGAPSAAATP